MGAVVTCGQRILAWCSTFARALRIVTTIAVCGVLYGCTALARVLQPSAMQRAVDRSRWRGKLTRWAFTWLGGSFIKVGQVLSSRPDLFSPPFIAELRSLQDHVPPFGFRQVERIVVHALGAPMARRFSAFAREPVAAGSIAQVHRAVLKNGDEVAVKVLRPRITIRIRRDAYILLWAAHLAQAVSARARTADVVGHTRSLIVGLLAQTNLRHEHNNYERFRRNFQSAALVKFPRMYSRYTTTDVLTMEFIHGTRLDATAPLLLPAVARSIREAFFAMCFDHGFVHTDLHPGNMLVEADGAVVLLDAGLVKKLPRGLLAQLVDFTRCITAGDANALVTHLQRYHRYMVKPDWAAVTQDAAVFISRLRASTMATLELATVIGDLFDLARKHRIRPLPEMTLVLLGMVTNEGVAKQLDPAANGLVAIATYLGSRMVAPTTSSAPQMARGSGEIALPRKQRTTRPPLPTPDVTRPRKITKRKIST
jgi:ubiquinone biosynthesis protein